MKGLQKIPTVQDLESAYSELLREPSLSQCVLYSQWSRFDPRLSEIWIRFISMYWKKLNAVSFNQELKQYPWPNSVGVLLEFVAKIIPREDQKLFLAWKQLILIEVNRAHFEQYFIGLRKIGGALMLEDANYSLREYSKWGYLGREILFNKAKSEKFLSHSFDLETRKKVAKKLIDQLGRISTNDYWNAIGRCVSRRQAERDLLRFSFLSARGNTKGRIFVKN